MATRPVLRSAHTNVVNLVFLSSEPRTYYHQSRQSYDKSEQVVHLSGAGQHRNRGVVFAGKLVARLAWRT